MSQQINLLYKNSKPYRINIIRLLSINLKKLFVNVVSYKQKRCHNLVTMIAIGFVLIKINCK